MRTNSTDPGKTVPGAWAELRRTRVDDRRGVIVYAFAVSVICLMVAGIVLLA